MEAFVCVKETTKRKEKNQNTDTSLPYGHADDDIML